MTRESEISASLAERCNNLAASMLSGSKMKGSILTSIFVGQKDKYAHSLICPKCITILYQNSPLYIDIFHFMILFLCCFVLFYTVYNFSVPKQHTQDSAVKSGHQVVESEDLQL